MPRPNRRVGHQGWKGRHDETRSQRHGRVSGKQVRQGPSGGTQPPGKSTVAKSRQGKVGILTYHAPEVAKQLKMLAAETGMTQAQLVAKGLNVVFRTYGKPTIAAEQ